MTALCKNKLVHLFAGIVTSLTFLANPLVQADVFKSIDQHPYCLLSQYPWLGLIMDEINYGPLSIWGVQLNQGNQIAIVKPGDVVQGKLSYRVDASQQEAFHRHHLVVGLHKIGAQDCVTHTWGLWDGSGKGNFSLKAPLEPGLYEVRFVYHEAPTCEEARSVWNNEIGEPSSFATIGAIIVG